MFIEPLFYRKGQKDITVIPRLGGHIGRPCTMPASTFQDWIRGKSPITSRNPILRCEETLLFEAIIPESNPNSPSFLYVKDDEYMKVPLSDLLKQGIEFIPGSLDVVISNKRNIEEVEAIRRKGETLASPKIYVPSRKVVMHSHPFVKSLSDGLRVPPDLVETIEEILSEGHFFPDDRKVYRKYKGTLRDTRYMYARIKEQYTRYYQGKDSDPGSELFDKIDQIHQMYGARILVSSFCELTHHYPIHPSSNLSFQESSDICLKLEEEFSPKRLLSLKHNYKKYEGNI